MKVLLVAERYWPEVGAAPSRLANMAEGLKGQGFDVDVLTSLPNYPKGRIFEGYRCCAFRKEERRGVNLFRYWMFATISRSPVARALNMFSFAIMIWLFALKVRRCRGYDVVVIQTPSLVVAKSAMLIFKGLYNKCCVLNVSDIWPLTAVDMGALRQGSRSWKYMCALEHYLYSKADGVLGQSEEILEHVRRSVEDMKGIVHPMFLYRNIQPRMSLQSKRRHGRLKLVFNGMLGVAQDVMGIVSNVPFGQLDVEFHILGGGKQLEEIRKYVEEHPGCNVFVHGFVPKDQMAGWLAEMDAGIVPLSTRIRGAFPSKVFDLLAHGLPVLYCGGGEAAHFVASREVGLVSEPSAYEALTQNISYLRDMDPCAFGSLSERCLEVTRGELDFNRQITDCADWLRHLSECS